MIYFIGSGIGDYNFDKINIDLKDFDYIICDKNYKENYKNLLKLSYLEAKDFILKNFNKKIAYIVSGSPLFFSAATSLIKFLPKNQYVFINNTSSKDYLLNRLAISENEVEFFSLHGRNFIDLTKFFNKKYTFILCDKDSLNIIYETLKYLDSNDYKITIGYKLGYKDEYIGAIKKDLDFSKPYVLLIEKNFSYPILEDNEFFFENGMITKKLKRSLTIANLDLKPNEIFWDIGAGSGSISIEAHIKHKIKPILFEKNKNRAKLIEKNLKKFKIIDCKLYIGDAVDFFDKAPHPNKIFIGGGGEKLITKIPFLYEILKENGIIIINIVTLNNLNSLITILNKFNLKFEIFSIDINEFKNNLLMSYPQRQMFQIKIKKD